LAAVGVVVPAPLDAAKQIIERGEQEGVRMRLLGGLAFKALCQSAKEAEFQRESKDIDLMGRREDTKKIMQIMKTLGYRPREIFNRLNLGKRLVYHDMNNGRRVDIFLDEFEMCHRFNFKDSLTAHPLTLPITDLVITKLQVVQMTEKEHKDLSAAFNDYEVTDHEGGINGARIAELCSKDWGIYRTFIGSLRLLKERATSKRITGRAERLLELIENRRKSLSWRLRAKVGESVRWYEIPDADVDVA